MQLSINDAMEIPVEQVKTYINIDEMDFYSHPMAIKLAKKHYEKQGCKVLVGNDFESSMLLALNADADRRALDDYTKVKLGRAKVGDDVNIYSDKVMSTVPKATVDSLLHLCRLCSYTGDPAFPDLILIKNDAWELNYVIFDELQLSHKMFILLAKLLDVDVGLCRVVFGEKSEAVRIVPSAVLGSVLSDSRALSIIHGIEEGLSLEKGRMDEARNTDELASVEDEIKYLQAEQQSKPFHVIKKWINAGMADGSDIIENMLFTMSNNEDEKKRFAHCEAELQDDTQYLPMALKKTEDAMRQKAAYFQKKFGMGPSRAKAFLRFLY